MTTTVRPWNLGSTLARCCIAATAMFVMSSNRLAISATTPHTTNHAMNTESTTARDPFVTTDLLRLRIVTSIDVSKDGKHAVYAVKSIAEAKPADENDDGEPVPPKYEYRSHLFVVDLIDASDPVQLTFGRRNDSSPRFSPDGSTVVFVRSPMKDLDAPSSKENKKKSQVWKLALSGGEAQQVTNFKEGVSHPVYSPHGNAIVVSSKLKFHKMNGSPSWDDERPGREWNDHDPQAIEKDRLRLRPDGTRAEIRAWLSQNETRENPSAINRLDFQDEQSLEKPYRFRQLFLVSLDSDIVVEQDDATQLTSDFFDHQDVSFSPDGRAIYFASKQPIDGRHPDRVLEDKLHIMMLDEPEASRIILASDDWSYSNPQPSLDGSVVAFLAEQTDEPNYRQTRLGLIGVQQVGQDEDDEQSQQQPVWLTETLDRSISDFEWMSAKGALVFGTASEGGFPLYSISPGLLEPETLVGGGQGAHVFAVGGGSIVYSLTTPSNPCVLSVQTARGTRVLHNLNEWVAEKTISMPEVGHVDRPDGVRVQYWIMEPTNLVGGEKYPLALEIHGGPSAMWGPGESSMWLEFQLLCSWGYGVVYCNPRGSGGYGYAFQRGNHKNWGTGPGNDVLAVVDRALAKPWVDRDRLVVTGGSYAGYLTAWIVGNDHRFKAAVAQRGVYDLATFFGEGNAWRLVPWAMGGYPWQTSTKNVLVRESPFTYVHRIQTPLLIMHASQDLRTGVSQSEMLYRALKVQEKPVEYVRYPNAGHDLSRDGDPYQRMDRLNRIIEFFERHIENERAAPIVLPRDDDE